MLWMILRRIGMNKTVKKVVESLPSVRQVVITLLASEGFVAVTGGFDRRAIITGLLLGVLFVAILTMRNFNPVAFEAHFNPYAYEVKTRSAEVAARLQALVDAYDKGDADAVAVQVTKARAVLTERYSSSTEE